MAKVEEAKPALRVSSSSSFISPSEPETLTSLSFAKHPSTLHPGLENKIRPRPWCFFYY